MRKGPLLVVSALAALALTAQLGPWRGVNVNRTGVSDATSITFAGAVTAGSVSAGPISAGGYISANNGLLVGGAQSIFSSSARFDQQVTAINANNALGGSFSGTFSGNGAGLTNLARPPETNWWAVFEIPNDDDRWFDLTLKASTNGFATDFLGGDSKVFIYTTAEPALNGTPAWERFETNWYPRVFYYFDHDYNHLSVWNPTAVNPNGTSSIHDSFEAEPGVLNPPVVKWVVMLRAQGPVNPTNWLSWAYLRQSNTDSEVTPAEGRAYWRATVPTWVTYDPRPRLHPGHPFYPTLTNQHQRP